jgi:hypothetical protein
MAKKKDDKKKVNPIPRKTATIPPPKKTDSKDTVLVAEQLKVIKAATTEHQLDVIADADNRPGVVAAIKARRDELKKPAEEAADKFPVEELKKAEEELLAPLAESVVEVETAESPRTSGPAAAPAPVVEEPVGEVIVKGEPPVAPQPATALEGGVLGSQTCEDEDAQELAAQKAQDGRAAKELLELRDAQVAADHARADVKRARAELERLEGVASGAEERAAREAAKGKPNPVPVEEPKPETEENVGGNPAPAEEKSESSSPPRALL